MATLKEVQKVELDMLKAVAQVCNRHQIDYYLAFGTMLGAVRHKGFIPWDDDIDIYVKQKDIKKLKKACIKELPEKYFWQDQQTDRSVPQLYKKIRNKNTLMYGSRTDPETEKKKQTQQGIWIDIMPMFRAANNEKLFDLQIKLMIQCQYLVFEQRKLRVIHGNNPISTLYMKLRELLLYRPLTTFLFNGMMMLQSKKSHQWHHFGFYSIGYRNDYNMVKQIAKDNLISDEVLSSKSLYDFEDTRLYGFTDYDTYLKKTYGDTYMMPIRRSHVDDYSNIIINDLEL